METVRFRVYNEALAVKDMSSVQITNQERKVTTSDHIEQDEDPPGEINDWSAQPVAYYPVIRYAFEDDEGGKKQEPILRSIHDADSGGNDVRQSGVSSDVLRMAET